MSMAEVIKSIECGAFREIQPHKIGGRNGGGYRLFYFRK